MITNKQKEALEKKIGVNISKESLGLVNVAISVGYQPLKIEMVSEKPMMVLGVNMKDPTRIVHSKDFGDENREKLMRVEPLLLYLDHVSEQELVVAHNKMQIEKALVENSKRFGTKNQRFIKAFQEALDKNEYDKAVECAEEVYRGNGNYIIKQDHITKSINQVCGITKSSSKVANAPVL